MFSASQNFEAAKEAPPKEFVHIFHPRASSEENKTSPHVQQDYKAAAPAEAPAEAASAGGVKFDLTIKEEQTTAAPTTPPAEALPPTQGKEASKSKSKPKKRQPSIFTVRNKLSQEVRETGADTFEVPPCGTNITWSESYAKCVLEKSRNP